MKNEQECSVQKLNPTSFQFDKTHMLVTVTMVFESKNALCIGLVGDILELNAGCEHLSLGLLNLKRYPGEDCTKVF